MGKSKEKTLGTWGFGQTLINYSLVLLMDDIGSWGYPLGAIQTDDVYKAFN